MELFGSNTSEMAPGLSQLLKNIDFDYEFNTDRVEGRPEMSPIFTIADSRIACHRWQETAFPACHGTRLSVISSDGGNYVVIRDLPASSSTAAESARPDSIPKPPLELELASETTDCG